MPYYRPCPVCGASLDPEERCDCRNKEKPPRYDNTGTAFLEEQIKKMCEGSAHT